MACTQLALAGVSFLKGASAAGGGVRGGGGDENTNKFEKLKANKQIPVKREEVCSQLQTKEFAWGVCNDDMGQYKWEF